MDYQPFVACRQTIGVDAFMATPYEAEVVLMAAQNFGFLLKDGTPQAKRYSFSAFADTIEAHYDLDNLENAETVRVLRRLASRDHTPALH